MAVSDLHRWGVDEQSLGTKLAELIAAEFSVRGVNSRVPADVYEQFGYPTRALRRARGSYYTPPALVEFVVEKALRPLLQHKSSAVPSLRIVDPSCGGGVFLCAALREIESHLVANGAKAGVALRRSIAEKCLVGVDVDAQALAVTRLSLSVAVGAPINPMLVCGDALNGALPEGNFDVFLGNPPWGQKHFVAQPESRRVYQRKYQCSRGVLDPFKLFVELAIVHTRVGGNWGYVLPDVILLKNVEDVRRLILRSCEIHTIADWGRAFGSVNMDAVVIVAQRVNAPKSSHRVDVQVGRSASANSYQTRRVHQAVFEELPRATFNLHANPRDLSLYRELRRQPNWSTLFHVHEGVHTGNSRAKLFHRQRRHASFRRVIVGGREIQRFRLDWGGSWLDPRPETLDRSAGDYANLGREMCHQTDKIVVRRTGDHIVAAVDECGYSVSNNMFAVVPKEPMSRDTLWAYVAVLNSRFMTWYFRTVQPRTGRLFAELKIYHLNEFPLPSPNRWDARVVKRLAWLARRCATDTSSPADELDEAVENLFALSRHRRATIRING